MRFAHVGGDRRLASPGLVGVCPSCEVAVIPKCGPIRVHHWAHRGDRDCDHWWEPRTEWHVRWQDQFPAVWQEVIRYGPSGEKHIADVHTPNGLTIEFQYSHMRAEERAAREAFYSNLIWVVACTTLKTALPRFAAAGQLFRRVDQGIYLVPNSREAFPATWLSCRAPVFFDFEGAPGLADETKSIVAPLWCLLPTTNDGETVLLRFNRDDFVRLAHQSAQMPPARVLQRVTATVSHWEQAERRRAARFWREFAHRAKERDRNPRKWRPRGPARF